MKITLKIADIKTKINDSNLVMNANIDVINKKITGSGFLKDYIFLNLY